MNRRRFVKGLGLPQKVRPILHKAFPFSEVRDAFAELERGRARGKIVVTMKT